MRLAKKLSTTLGNFGVKSVDQSRLWKSGVNPELPKLANTFSKISLFSLPISSNNHVQNKQHVWSDRTKHIIADQQQIQFWRPPYTWACLSTSNKQILLILTKTHVLVQPLSYWLAQHTTFLRLQFLPTQTPMQQEQKISFRSIYILISHQSKHTPFSSHQQRFVDNDTTSMDATLSNFQALLISSPTLLPKISTPSSLKVHLPKLKHHWYIILWPLLNWMVAWEPLAAVQWESAMLLTLWWGSSQYSWHLWT